MEAALIKPVKKQSSNKYWPLYTYAVIFSVLLFVRDYGGIGINKYLFVALTLFAVCTLDIKKTLCLFCFLMPLYVGLPGNYMTFVFFGRFLLEWKYFKFPSVMFLSALAACTFMCIQNVMQGMTTIGHMATIPGIIMVLFLFCYDGELDKNRMILMFSVGVAVMGLIMLLAALNKFSLQDLMSDASRFGREAEYLNENKEMFVSVDPNYYGLFTISAISVSFPLLFKKLNKGQKPILIISLLSCLSVALIGLSRAFILVLLLWALFALFTQVKLKNVFISIFVFVAIFVIAIAVFPDVFENILRRFTATDVAGGNGRGPLINKFLGEWSETILTLIFGVGMYECNVHCMPLQVIFGGGLVYTVIMALFFIALLHSTSTPGTKKKLMDYVPVILTFIMTCTVPIATSLTFMFPFIIAMFVIKNKENKI